MNSEELELSLRTEFESYLKGFLAELRHEVSEFQKNFETEFEKHKAQTDEAVRKLVGRFDAAIALDHAFNESVIEHLRLARDEGATLTATAIGEAEKLKEQAAPAANFDKLRDAIDEISSKASQSEILRLLVDHASHFAPRGAFFIVKNEQFVGWRAFGEAIVDDDTIRSINFPMSADTILSEAISTLGTAASASNSQAENDVFLEKLGFGTPDRMYAIPLVARGRGVAVLYADYGAEGLSLNPEALETLVRVAGLTVELGAATAQAAQPAPAEAAPEPGYQEQADHEPAAAVAEPVQADSAVAEAELVEEEYAGVQEFEHADVQALAPNESPTEEVATEVEPSAQSPEHGSVPVEATPEATGFELVETAEVEEEPTASVDAVKDDVRSEQSGEVIVQEVEEVTYYEPVAEEPVEEYVPVEAVEEFPEVIEEPAAPVVAESPVETVTSPAPRTRYRDRNVELPIEVPEDERRLHNDARRFARLLVSEIKLYNEQKVAEGRERGDLYDRLREAIDRSRDMYDKRVQQPVADKFDYFHFELVSSLAEGEDVRLGASYPGSKVPA